MRSRYIVGEKFGRLLVLEELLERREGHIVVKCMCDCGTVVLPRRSSVCCGKTTSCGCFSLELKRKKQGHVSINDKFVHYTNSAKARGYEFSLTKEEFTSIIFRDCFYCGSKPKPYNRYYRPDGTLRKGKTSKASADRAWININGIDRFDNNIGYTLSNSVPCCSECNLAKGEMSGHLFVILCKRVASFQTSKDVKWDEDAKTQRN